jgi:5-methyltetrahydrofolate--homocysteine methyltransferase
LPERGFINAAFLAMMIDSGLTMAIANPNQALLMNTALSCNLLLNREEADLIYIERMNRLQEEGVTAEQITAVKKTDTPVNASNVSAKPQNESDASLSERQKN